MLRWDDVKSEFTFEGSWRDICVPATSIEDWQAVLEAFRTAGYLLDFSARDQAVELPEHASTLFATSSRGTGLLRVRVGGVVFACHFFDQTEIEFDLDPRDMLGQAQLDALLEVMTSIAQATHKVAMMTPENMHDTPIILVQPTGDAEYRSSSGFFEELAKRRDP